MRLRELNSLGLGALVRFNDDNRVYKILEIETEAPKGHRVFLLGSMGSSPTSPIKVPDWALAQSNWQLCRATVRKVKPPPLERLRL